MKWSRRGELKKRGVGRVGGRKSAARMQEGEELRDESRRCWEVKFRLSKRGSS